MIASRLLLFWLPGFSLFAFLCSAFKKVLESTPRQPDKRVEIREQHWTDINNDEEKKVSWGQAQLLFGQLLFTLIPLTHFFVPKVYFIHSCGYTGCLAKGKPVSQYSFRSLCWFIETTVRVRLISIEYCPRYHQAEIQEEFILLNINFFIFYRRPFYSFVLCATQQAGIYHSVQLNEHTHITWTIARLCTGLLCL